MTTQIPNLDLFNDPPSPHIGWTYLDGLAMCNGFHCGREQILALDLEHTHVQNAKDLDLDDDLIVNYSMIIYGLLRQFRASMLCILVQRCIALGAMYLPLHSLCIIKLCIDGV